MDRISQLPDELLLNILSFLPSTKHVIKYTVLLSKRWQFLWKMVPKLVYDYKYHYIWSGGYSRLSYTSFSQFVDRSLFRHEAPVIETLHIKLGKVSTSGDIGVWIRDAYKRRVRELIIDIDTCDVTPVTLPRSLYTCCRLLVTLKLRNAVLVDDDVSFPFLKILSLVNVKYPNIDFVRKLLRCCPVLEDLVMEQYPLVSVTVPSLKSLVLRSVEKRDVDYNGNTFVIHTPSLESLDIVDHHSWFCVLENMPKIETANLDVTYIIRGNTLGSLTSVKRLNLCLSTSKDVYPVGIVFHRLVHLKLCTCEKEWLNLLMRVLGDSPNLRSLKLGQRHNTDTRPYWSEPSSVPDCLSSSLETFEWVSYEGETEAKEAASFILRNSNCLKKATIISSEYIHCHKKHEMLRVLALCPRASRTCQLQFY